MRIAGSWRMPVTDVISFPDVGFFVHGAVHPPKVMECEHTQHRFAYPMLWNLRSVAHPTSCNKF
jgi:hypothetical protein